MASVLYTGEIRVGGGGGGAIDWLHVHVCTRPTPCPKTDLNSVETLLVFFNFQIQALLKFNEGLTSIKKVLFIFHRTFVKFKMLLLALNPNAILR